MVDYQIADQPLAQSLWLVIRPSRPKACACIVFARCAGIPGCRYRCLLWGFVGTSGPHRCPWSLNPRVSSLCQVGPQFKGAGRTASPCLLSISLPEMKMDFQGGSEQCSRLFSSGRGFASSSCGVSSHVFFFRCFKKDPSQVEKHTSLTQGGFKTIPEFLTLKPGAFYLAW